MSEIMVSNKHVILNDYISADFPKETDLSLTTSTIDLKLTEGSNGILVKNLYLSCNPSMGLRMRKFKGCTVNSFTPSLVSDLFTFSFFDALFFGFS